MERLSFERWYSRTYNYENRSKRTRGCPPYVISGIRGVTGGVRPEVFELMRSLRATEALNGNRTSPTVQKGGRIAFAR